MAESGAKVLDIRAGCAQTLLTIGTRRLNAEEWTISVECGSCNLDVTLRKELGIQSVDCMHQVPNLFFSTMLRDCFFLTRGAAAIVIAAKESVYL